MDCRRGCSCINKKIVYEEHMGGIDTYLVKCSECGTYTLYSGNGIDKPVETFDEATKCLIRIFLQNKGVI